MSEMLSEANVKEHEIMILFFKPKSMIDFGDDSLFMRATPATTNQIFDNQLPR